MSPIRTVGARGEVRRPLVRAGEWLARRSQGVMPARSVVVHAPSHVFQSPGGGENQLVQTGRHLEGLGHEVRPFNPWLDQLDHARLLHIFGMSRESLALASVARARGVPVVLSPICWYEPRAILALAPNRVRGLADLAGWATQRLMPRWPRWRRSLLRLADVVLPNSEAEADQLRRQFAIDERRIRVVPNGVEARFQGADPVPWFTRYGSEPFLLYVGRIEPRKNVMGLVRACRRAGLPLTVIGGTPPGHDEYRQACREEAGSEVRWVAPLGHDDELLASAYAAAKVVALPSWFETPGLAALEGALAGTAVVVTPYGSAGEYFGDRVEYARPDHPSEVVRAVVRAWECGPDPRLASHVGSRFLWPEVARRTAEAYGEVAA